MLRHFVFLEITDSQEAVRTISSSLEALSSKMGGCLHFCFGKCVGEGARYHYFFMDFLDETARNSYVNHPEHVKVAQEIIIPKLKEGIQSVVVFDYIQEKLEKMSSIKSGAYGYILVKAGEETRSLEELTGYCDKLNKLRPLQNCSVEPLGKEYAYALNMQLKEGSQPIQFRQSPAFWVTSERSEKSFLEKDFTPLSTKSPSIYSKL